MGGRHLRRLRLAGRRAADRRGRPGARLRRRADPLDDARRRADRAAARRSCRSTSTRSARRAPAGRRRRSSATPPRPPRRCSRPASPATGFRAHARRSRARSPPARGATRLTRTPATTAHMDPRTLSIALDALLPGRAHGRRRLRALHGLPADVPARPGPAGLRLHAGVPVDRARPGERDRRRDRAARPADRRLPRRRRRADGAARAGDARPPAAADARRGLQRRRLRRRGPPLRPAGRSRSSWCASRTPTSPRSPAPPARRASPRATPSDLERDRARGSSAATARSSSMRRSRPTSARNGSRRPSSDPSPVARRAARRRRGDRPHPAAERDDAGAQAARAVREHARPHAPRDQPLRRPRAGVGVVLAGDRRARRHPLRRADPLDHRPRRRGRRLGAGRSGWSARRS